MQWLFTSGPPNCSAPHSCIRNPCYPLNFVKGCTCMLRNLGLYQINWNLVLRIYGPVHIKYHLGIIYCQLPFDVQLFRCINIPLLLADTISDSINVQQLSSGFVTSAGRADRQLVRRKSATFSAPEGAKLMESNGLAVTLAGQNPVVQ